LSKWVIVARSTSFALDRKAPNVCIKRQALLTLTTLCSEQLADFRAAYLRAKPGYMHTVCMTRSLDIES